MKLNIAIVVLVVAIVALGGFFFLRKKGVEIPFLSENIASRTPQNAPPPVATSFVQQQQQLQGESKREKAERYLKIGGTVGCTAVGSIYVSPAVAAPVCGIAAPLITDISIKSTEKAVGATKAVVRKTGNLFKKIF